ncbi:MAG: hypothetical protein KME19_11910 [Microcoleus vaginatus WJT46-NPBG5]|nr:hypothetical protein [Microcoleus vaginatus WJT46-NPBG5]
MELISTIINLAKTGLPAVLLIGLCLGALIVLPTHLAVAQERRLVEDENGDYYIEGERGSLPYEWEVVDPDPNGLNCRLADRAKGQSQDYYNFPIANTFKQEERIRGPRISLYDRGLPWIWIGTDASRYHCWVRANSRLVRPVRQIKPECLHMREC